MPDNVASIDPADLAADQEIRRQLQQWLVNSGDRILMILKTAVPIDQAKMRELLGYLDGNFQVTQVAQRNVAVVDPKAEGTAGQHVGDYEVAIAGIPTVAGSSVTAIAVLSSFLRTAGALLGGAWLISKFESGPNVDDKTQTFGQSVGSTLAQATWPIWILLLLILAVLWLLKR